MSIRSQLVQRVEGKALMRDSSGRWQVLVAMRADRQFWIEIRSPMGGAFAVLRADEDWVEFYIPRRKELYRIPSAEFWRNSARQKRFLELLPVKIKPEQMLELVFGRIDPVLITNCKWRPDLNAYAVLLKDEGRSRYVLLDPISYFPIQTGQASDMFYVKHVPGTLYQAETLEFASKFEFYQNKHKEMSFEWIELSWRAELGAKAPFFPESLGVKRINY
ncbi:MAG: hypothetical protein R3A80_04560 [Bdellovibrionota bacterium]